MLPSHLNPYLVRLEVSNNNIFGQIPKNLSIVFPNLSLLNLFRNAFVGNVTSSLGDLKSLRFLDLSNNLLSRGIPVDLAIGPIWFIKLSNNKLQGKIFPRLVSPTALHYLYLDGNNFVGEIPDSLSNIDLWGLDVSDNHFSGQLPRWMGNLSNLIEISMHKNHLEGPIPVEFCKLTFLRALDLSGNNISGSILSCFNPPGITHVHLNKNKLNGLMTRAFYNSSSLVTLDLSENSLKGSIPDWIDTLSSLSILLLKDNHFEGRIPIQLCHLKQLSLMDLSQNYLSGPIPPCLSDLTFVARTDKYYVRNVSFQDYTLKDFSLAYLGNSWMIGLYKYQVYSINFIEEQVEFTTKSNSYSCKGNILKFMSGVDLSCNQLTGEIPPEIGNFSQIRSLNLSHNNLIGTIPPTFSNLKQIESLDLSYNLLNGRIPNQSTELNSLAVFSVAHNNLSGTTPNRKAQFGTFEESSYEGNPLLCGLPLNRSCPRTGSPSPVPIMSNSSNNGKGEDSGFIDMNVFYVSFIASYTTVLLAIALVLYINPYWRRAWFYLIEVGITSCYYFILDNFPKFPVFRRHV